MCDKWTEKRRVVNTKTNHAVNKLRRVTFDLARPTEIYKTDLGTVMCRSVASIMNIVARQGIGPPD